jgi:hypothetical protein
VHVLLTSKHKLNNPKLGWAHTYKGTRVVYIQLGHDHYAYQQPELQQMVARAIRWTARKK